MSKLLTFSFSAVPGVGTPAPHTYLAQCANHEPISFTTAAGARAYARGRGLEWIAVERWNLSYLGGGAIIRAIEGPDA